MSDGRMHNHCCFDNHLFNINGAGPTMLAKVLEVALLQHGRNATFKAFKKHKTLGVVLYWTVPESNGTPCEDVSAFLSPPTPEELARQICELIGATDKWFDMKSLEGWEADADHDGDNSMGWRAYCGEWGHVGERWEAMVAVKPCWMWHGK